ncbi:MAG TPA: TetR-like C-terminal domain-containing protein [Streptosporangiaceae bacterium]|nr:TetR-like C-terminal domain-containing protein [Streptosporangiaceae bacterium]
MTARANAVAGQPGHRSRRASEDVEEAILSATLEILDDSGFQGLTVEKVAARAGAAKTAVYRRWPSKVPLVVEALTRAQPELPVPDTGDLRTDMIRIWESASGGGRYSVERLLPVVTAYMSANDELMALMRERYFRPRLEAVRVVVARAAARGEIRPGTNPELAFDLLFGPLAYRWLRGSPPDDETIGRLVGLALQGLGPPRDQDS